MEMLTATLVAFAVAGGMPVAIAGLTIAAVWNPLLALGGVGVLHAVGRRRDSGESDAQSETRYLAAVADELSAGATLRQALVDAAGRVPGLNMDRAVRLASAGSDAESVSEAIARTMPVHGMIVGSAVRLAAANGGAATGIFNRLALRAHAHVELDHELAVATAQARMSVRILVAIPVVLTAALALSGQAVRLVSSGPVGAAAFAIGIGLQVVGVGVVLSLIRGVEP